MMNLIPKEEKSRMKVDFYFRLTILFLTTLDFCILVLAICVLPSYFFSSTKAAVAEAKLEAQKAEPLPVFDEETLAVIKDVNGKTDLVENSEKKKFPLSSEVIDAILLRKRADIKITQIIYKSGEKEGRKINITGTAPSREVLLLFRLALEESPAFKSVDLPISNFVKGKDIQFNLSLTPP